MDTIAKPVDNGVDVEFLRGAREALTAAPEGASFQWRVTNTWVHGTHSRSTAKDYFGLGEEQSHRTEFRFEGDHPELFSAEDNGATPTEVLLVALASCLAAGVAAVAEHREIQLHSVSASVCGDIDIRGILGIDSDVRNGFSDVTVTYDIDADATQDEIEALVAQSQKRSAVFDIVANPTNVNVQVTKRSSR